MTNKQPEILHAFAGNPLDRGDRERRDEKLIVRMAKDPKSKFLPLSDLDVLMSNGPDQGLGWLSADELGQLGVDRRVIFLGLRSQAAYFAVDITDNGPAVQGLRDSGNWRFEDVLAISTSGTD